jgi:signal transduction histidine kinase
MRAIRVSTAPLLAALAIAGVVVAAAVTGSRPLADDLAIGVAVTTYAFVAVVIELARPGHPVGRLMLAGATAWGIGEGLLALGLAGVVAAPDRAAYVVLGVVGSAARGCGWLLLILALPLVFPDGRAPGRAPVALVAGCVSAFTVATLLAPVPLETRLETVANPLGLPPSWRPLADLLALGALAAAFVALLIAVATLVRRWRTGGELVRQQVLVFGVAFAVPLLLLPFVATPWAQPWMFALVTLPVPAAVAVAMFQRRLYDLQFAANRTLTYVALSVMLAVVYAFVVGGVGVVLHDSGAPWLPLAAAGVIAVLFAPLRDSLQRAANRLTHGRWSTPAEVLADTGRRLADAADGPALLASLTHELVHGLGVAAAEIRDATGRQLAATGAVPDEVETLPLMAYGGQVGELRWASRPLRPGERALLADLAHQIGGVVHTTALLESLREAREELVVGREQERRRLRRDLHDGLGPQLAALGLQLDTVHNLLAAGRPVDDQIARLRAGLQDTVVEVRQIVEGLRPPAIDELGLFGAVAELGHQLIDGSGVVLALELPEERRALPAAVEVAAYRVAQEALTNVVRHAGATCCRVKGAVGDGHLVLEVVDDGVGGARPGRGVGLRSMRDRAREIGGRIEVDSTCGGTTVTISLPLAVETAS